MRLLPDSVVKRLAGKSRDPVIQLQPAFGVDKTHTLLATYQLDKGKAAASQLLAFHRCSMRRAFVNEDNRPPTIQHGHSQSTSCSSSQTLDAEQKLLHNHDHQLAPRSIARMKAAIEV